MRKRLAKKYYPALKSINDGFIDTIVTKAGVKFCCKLAKAARSIAIPVDDNLDEWFDHFDDKEHMDYVAKYLNPNWHEPSRTINQIIYHKNHRKPQPKG